MEEADREDDYMIRRMKTLRLLVVEHECDDLIDEMAPRLLLPLYTSDKPLSELYLLQQRIFPPYSNAALEVRIQNVFWICDPEWFWITLGQPQLTPSCFLDSGPHSLFPKIAHCSQLMKECGCEEGWRNILKQAVDVNGHLSWDQARSSPLVYYLSSSIWFPGCHNLRPEKVNAHIQENLQKWVWELSKAGADLVEYGQLEHEHFIKHRDIYRLWVDLRVSRSLSGDCRCDVLDFTYGPNVEDWKIWLLWPLDEWAGDFWYQIENPELFGPGAWVEEAYEDDDEYELYNF